MYEITVIVPVYNVQKYLRQCLDSLYQQVRPDYEVILVNDGSTDESPAICREYQQKYPNTIVVDQENAGLSAARNAGIKIAKGNYIYFLDSDDWLAPNAIKLLYDIAINKQCEVVQGGFFYAYEIDCYLDDRYIKMERGSFVLSKEEAMRELIRNKYIKNFAWGKLYRADIVKRHLFHNGVYFEDSYWQHLIMDEVTNYGVLPKPLYYYRQRETGISGTFSMKNMDLLRGNELRLSFIKEKYPSLADEMAKSFWKNFYSIYQIARVHPDPKIRIAYRDEWRRVNIKYRKDFSKALRYNLCYRLYSDMSGLLSIYNYATRAYDRFFGKGLRKISY